MGELDDALRSHDRVASAEQTRRDRLRAHNLRLEEPLHPLPLEVRELVAEFLSQNKTWERRWYAPEEQALFSRTTASNASDGIIKLLVNIVIDAVRRGRRNRAFQQVDMTYITVSDDLSEFGGRIGLVRQLPTVYLSNSGYFNYSKGNLKQAMVTALRAGK